MFISRNSPSLSAFAIRRRGYIVSANSRQEAMKKLVTRDLVSGVDSINIAEILLDEDVF